MASASMNGSVENRTEDKTGITLRGMVVQLEPRVINKIDDEENTVVIMRIEILSSEHDKLVRLLHNDGYGDESLNDKHSTNTEGVEIGTNRFCINGSYKPTTTTVTVLETTDLLTQCTRCKTVAENLKWVSEVAFENTFGRDGTHPNIEEVAFRSNNLRVPEHVFRQLEREPNLEAARGAVICINDVFDWYMPLINNLPLERYLTILKNHFRSERLHLRRLKNILTMNETSKHKLNNEGMLTDQIAPVNKEAHSDDGLEVLSDVTNIKQGTGCQGTLHGTEVNKTCFLWNGTVNLDIISRTDTLATIETCATIYKRACDVIRIIDLISDWKRRI